MSNLNPQQFSYRVEDEGNGYVRAYQGDTSVGYVNYDTNDGFVQSMKVQPEHRRRGLAHRMLDAMPVRPTFAMGAEDVGNTKEGWATIQSYLQRRLPR